MKKNGCAEDRSAGRVFVRKYMRVPLKNLSGLVRLLCLEPSQEVALQKHSEADEVFYVVRGVAEFTKSTRARKAKKPFD